MSLGHNELSGPIPPELGRLPAARLLALDHNALTGPVPPELASLPEIERLYLDNNDLTGPVPAAFGAMTTLRELGLTNNPSMAGPLPADLVSLRRLEVLMADRTGLCVPGNDAMLAWLERVHKRRISACGSGEPPKAYLIQAVQSREWPVPLVAGEEALLRVFVTAPRPTTATIPTGAGPFLPRRRRGTCGGNPRKAHGDPNGSGRASAQRDGQCRRFPPKSYGRDSRW